MHEHFVVTESDDIYLHDGSRPSCRPCPLGIIHDLGTPASTDRLGQYLRPTLTLAARLDEEFVIPIHVMRLLSHPLDCLDHQGSELL